MERCQWAGPDPLSIDYHDTEWGVPCRDDRALFELLILEGAQAGLSWNTILRKRQAYRLAYDGSTRRQWPPTTTPRPPPFWPTPE